MQKTGHIKKFCPLNKNSSGSRGNHGDGGDSKGKSEGKSEKPKKKWHNLNAENKTTMEKNGKKHYWCKTCSYGRGRWVDHEGENCPYKKNISADESGTKDSDNAGLMVINLVDSGFLAIELL